MLASDALIARTLRLGHLLVIFNRIAFFRFPSAVLCS